MYEDPVAPLVLNVVRSDPALHADELARSRRLNRLGARNIARAQRDRQISRAHDPRLLVASKSNTNPSTTFASFVSIVPSTETASAPSRTRSWSLLRHKFKEDDDAYVAILTGAGSKSFCSGGDLKAADRLLTAEHLEKHDPRTMPGVLGPSRWTDIYKPIVAAVNGTAYAGGLEWACFATASVVSTSAITPIAGSIERR